MRKGLQTKCVLNRLTMFAKTLSHRILSATETEHWLGVQRCDSGTRLNLSLKYFPTNYCTTVPVCVFFEILQGRKIT